MARQKREPQIIVQTADDLIKGRAVMTIDLRVLEAVLPVPDGYRIVSVHAEPRFNAAQFVVESMAIKETEIGKPLPEVDVDIREVVEDGRLKRISTPTVRYFTND